ncbi:MAG: AMP-binding protein, partial [Acidimicrobiales bacterium]
MADFGFWVMAQEQPDEVALVAPDGTELTAGELLGRANQVVGALRELGLKAGDTIAFVLPNSVEVFEIYLAAMQAGWYIVPINHHLVAPEIAYIVRDSDAAVFVAHERFAAECTAAADEAEVPVDHRLSVGEIPGFTSFSKLRDVQPTEMPEDRTLGDTMNYTSGTTGNPKGVRRTLSGANPDDGALGLAGILLLFGIGSRDDHVHIVGSPLYHTAVLRFSGASMHMGHRVVLMDKWDAEEMLALMERHRVTHSHMVPTQFHRLLALSDDVKH